MVLVHWCAGAAEVVDLHTTADDAVVLAAAARAHVTGLDSPLGWPEPFVRFVAAVHTGDLLPPDGDPAVWRRGLARRRTDEVVHRTTGLVPLSVSADRLAHPAFRAAALLATARRGITPPDACGTCRHQVPAASGSTGAVPGRARATAPDVTAPDVTARDGTGRFVEAYPAAALRTWGLPCRGYKDDRGRDVRERVVTGLAAAAPTVRWGPALEEARRSDHVLDALVCAFVARAAHLGRYRAPHGGAETELARTEGWIVVPGAPPGELVDTDA